MTEKPLEFLSKRHKNSEDVCSVAVALCTMPWRARVLAAWLHDVILGMPLRLGPMKSTQGCCCLDPAVVLALPISQGYFRTSSKFCTTKLNSLYKRAAVFASCWPPRQCARKEFTRKPVFVSAVVVLGVSMPMARVLFVRRKVSANLSSFLSRIGAVTLFGQYQVSSILQHASKAT